MVDGQRRCTFVPLLASVDEGGWKGERGVGGEEREEGGGVSR